MNMFERNKKKNIAIYNFATELQFKNLGLMEKPNFNSHLIIHCCEIVIKKELDSQMKNDKL